ncbi:Copia protein [Folsomia candida]|uniref:Copia protein n=1 Tax=Folsomia candida TaxID=158441 RepID=A0A226DMH0_FOLCA|nr:Copia protein [Folsomia candida]
MKKVETSHIPKLNGDNYQPWKLQVTLALQAGGVWGYIDGTKKKPTLKTDGSNQTDVDKWDENDVGARSLIVQLLEQGQMAHIYACDSAKTTWEKIAEVNSDASILNVQRTLTRFYNFKISEDRSAVEACGELEELARALKEMGNPVTAQALVIKAVSSLPESKFHAFKRAWGSVDAASQTMANLIARIKNEELSFKANGEGGEEQQQFNIAFNAQNGNKKFQKGKSNQQQQQQQPQKKKREGACRNCGIEGHWARECRKPKREEGDEAKCNNNNNNNNSNRKQNRKNNKKQNEGPGDCQAFLGGHEMEEGSTRWISDSGASFHITGRKDWLTDYKEFKNPIPVSITDNSSIRALGKGTVQVEAWVQGEWYPISIHNAHYIPGAVNLFSEGIMDQKGFKIVKENGKTTYYFKGQQGPQAWWLNGNYVMGFRVPKNSAYSATINKTKLWHERLAHVNMGYIKNAVKVGAVEGIKMEDLASDFHCSDCHLGKETRQPFPEREKNKNLQPGDVIHADLSGKDSTTSLQGSNYFLLLKDEKTGFRQGVNVQNSQPILWRGSPVPVISGYETVYLRIKLISPCTLLTEEIVPKGQLETAKKICNEMYETYFIHEMKQMCPSFHNFSMSKHRPKRFILVALIALGAVVVTGLGIGGVVLAANNAARISDLEEISSLQEKSINQLEEQMNFTEIALQKLRTDFNILVKDHEVLDKNLNEITEKGPNTYFTISYITTKLMMGKQVIKEATRAWNNKKILNGMMDYFNITLPCGEDECPLSLATGKRCYFGEDMKDLYIQMDMPKVNKALQLVEADAFDLMLQTWNQTCRITYNGPENAILSKKEGCPVALNLKTSRMYDLVLSSSQDCLKGFKNKSENSYFSVKHCQGRGEKDAEDFIQVKPHHGSLHVYCFGCNITIDNLSQECPKEVFILPIGARFRINNQEFTGSIVHIEHQDSPDPLFTMRTNAYLKPRVDYQELMKDPMVNNHFVFSKGETWTHSETWHMEIGLIITLLVVIIVLACILTKCYLDHRKIKVKVVTKPKPLRNQEIEEDEDSQ